MLEAGLIAGAVIAGIAALLGGVLLWQSTIKPPPYDELFVVRWDEPLTAGRDEQDRVVIRWQADRSVRAIYAGSSPDAIDRSRPLAQPDGGTSAVLEMPRLPRPFFEVVLADGTRQIIAERILPLEGVANFRDIGGYPAADGCQVRWGLVFRSGHLSEPTEADRAYLTHLGVRLVCDLRSSEEAAGRPNHLPETITCLHSPVFDVQPFGKREVLFQRQRLPGLMRETYRTWIIDRGAAVYGDLFRRLADPANLPAVIHCTGGKDRTGVAVALLLLMLGVPEKIVIDDYTISNLSAEKMVDLARDEMARRRTWGLRVEQLYPVMAVPPDLLLTALAHLRERYGSVEGYLLGPAGLEPAHLDRLRGNLLWSGL